MPHSGKGIKEPWHYHPLTIAIIGSIIVVVGQLSATLFPIWLGPDLSDYNLLCNPIYQEIRLTDPVKDAYDTTNWSIINKTSEGLYTCYFISNIKIINLHPIHKYNRQVSLTVTCPPGFSAVTSEPVISDGHPTSLVINANLTHLISDIKDTDNTPKRYPIIVQGIGAEGKKRNCTVIVAWNIDDNAEILGAKILSEARKSSFLSDKYTSKEKIEAAERP